jgi:mannitol-specific phosphotransferase system IIBC component
MVLKCTSNQIFIKITGGFKMLRNNIFRTAILVFVLSVCFVIITVSNNLKVNAADAEIPDYTDKILDAISEELSIKICS